MGTTESRNATLRNLGVAVVVSVALTAGCSGGESDGDDRTAVSAEAVDAELLRYLESGVDFDPDPSAMSIGVTSIGFELGSIVFEQTGEADPVYPEPSGFLEEISESASSDDRYGEPAISAIANAEEFFGDYRSSDEFTGLSDSDQRDVSRTSLAVGVVLALGGPIGDEVAELIESVDDPVELHTEFRSTRFSDVGTYVSEFRSEIRQGAEDRARSNE